MSVSSGAAGWGPPPRIWFRLFLTAVSRLIRAIPTVVTPVTQPLLGDAAVVLAFELGL